MRGCFFAAPSPSWVSKTIPGTPNAPTRSPHRYRKRYLAHEREHLTALIGIENDTQQSKERTLPTLIGIENDTQRPNFEKFLQHNCISKI